MDRAKLSCLGYYTIDISKYRSQVLREYFLLDTAMLYSIGMVADVLGPVHPQQIDNTSGRFRASQIREINGHRIRDTEVVCPRQSNSVLRMI